MEEENLIILKIFTGSLLEEKGKGCSAMELYKLINMVFDKKFDKLYHVILLSSSNFRQLIIIRRLGP